MNPRMQPGDHTGTKAIDGDDYVLLSLIGASFALEKLNVWLFEKLAQHVQRMVILPMVQCDAVIGIGMLPD